MQISVNNTDRQNRTEDMDANKFFSRYPDAPEPGFVEVLNLNLKTKEEGLDILSGKTKVIYKKAIPFYDNIIYNRDVDKWIDKKVAEGADEEFLCRFVSPFRCVLKLHLNDYRDSWFVDVNVSEMGYLVCRKDLLAKHNMRFGCKWLYEEASDFEEYLEVAKAMALEEGDVKEAAKLEEDRPKYYYFVIESIYDTNLVNAKAYKRDDMDQSIDEVIPFLDK